MTKSKSARLLCFVLFLLSFVVCISVEGAVRRVPSGPPFLVQQSTSREAAVFAAYLANEPSLGVSTSLSVSNVVMPSGTSLGFGAVSPTFSHPGTLEFHLYSRDGKYYFYETSGNSFTEGVGSGLDSAGVLRPGATYVVTLDDLLQAVEAERSFAGYAWIIGHFPAIQGTDTIFNEATRTAHSFELQPPAGSSLASHGNLAGIPRGPEELTIGLLAEITGPIPAVGASCVNAAQLALEEINAAGGLVIGGVSHPLRLLIGDTEGSPEKSAELASELINRTSAVALIGPNSSGNAIPAADVAEEQGIALITPWSTNPRTTLDAETLLPKKNVFRVCFTDVFQGKVLSKFARETLHAGKAAVLYDRNAAVLKSQADLFSESFEEAGGQIVATEEYATGDTDFSAQFTRIKAAGPDVIFLPSYYTDVPSQVRQARSVGIDVPFLGSDAWSTPQLITECGADCEGIFLSNHYSAESSNPLAAAFVAAYRGRFGVTPDDVAALTYDAFGFLRAGLEKSGMTGRLAVLKGLREIRTFHGVTGDMLFEEGSGDPVKGAVILQIKNGKFTWFADVAP